MIVYGVTIKIKKEVEDSWFKWMREIHIPDVLNTGYFIDWQIKKLLLPESNDDESTYVIDYMTDSIEKYYEYQKKESRRLQKEHFIRFSGKFKAQRAIYYSIQE